jgi:UDP-GlcNAc:undecaprenyl-phosphate/decaprenyl-phosphate GlcNAc-1-phosphate transferase
MNPLTYVPVLVVSFLIALMATPVSRQIAMRLGVVDKPNQRKIHNDHKPLMGGLAIYVAFAAAMLLFSTADSLDEILALLAGATLLAVTGLLDDRFNLGVGIRLSVMTLSAVILIMAGIYIRLFNFPLIDYTLTILWVVGLTNALNFLDNMDGQCAGLSGISAFFFLLIAATEGLPLVSALAAGVLGGALGFLVYNFNPASTFMGDMGALMLGYTLAALGIQLEFGVQPINVTWMVPILVLAVPIFDINLVVWTRIFEGRSPFEAGKDHTSHRLMSMGLSQRQTIFVMYGMAALLGLIGFFVGEVPPEIALALGLATLFALALLFALMVLIRRQYQLPSKTIQQESVKV